MGKLNTDLPPEDINSLLAEFCADGKVCFEKLVDGLFSGEMTQPAKSSYNLAGLQPLSDMSTDEANEVERVLTDALLELHGEFEGEYYPLPSSCSYPARIGGMSEQEAKSLEKSGMLFSAPECSGRGVFANTAMDVAVLVNHESHVQFVVKPPLGDNETGRTRLRSLEKVMRDALKLSGYDLI